MERSYLYCCGERKKNHYQANTMKNIFLILSLQANIFIEQSKINAVRRLIISTNFGFLLCICLI